MSLYIFIFILIVFFVYKFYKTKKYLYILLLSGFLLRLVLLFTDIKYELLPYSWDTHFFTYISAQIKHNLLNYHFPLKNINESIHVTSYSMIQSVIYLITGYNELSMRIFNSFLGAYSGILIYKISYNIFKKKGYSFITTSIFLFWPSFILYTSINMREALIIYLTLYILYNFYDFKIEFSYDNILILFHILLLVFLKIPNILFLAIIIISYIIIKNIINNTISLKKGIIILLILIITGLLIIQAGLIPKFSLYEINEEMVGRTRGGSKYLENMVYENSFDIIRYLPIRFIHFLFGPFLNFQSPYMMISSLDGLLILLMFIYYLYTFFKNKLYNNNYELLLLLYFFIGISGNAVFDANYGTALRHRMTYIIVLFIYIAPVMKRGYENAINYLNSNKR